MIRALFIGCVCLAMLAASATGGFVRSDARSATRTAAPALELPRLLGFANGTLVRVDPQSLQPLAGTRIRVGSGGCAGRGGGSACWSDPPWTASLDGKRLAVARNDAFSVDVIDAARMRVLARVPISEGPIGALAWLSRNRLLAVQEIGGEQQRLLVLDLPGRRVVARRPLGGSVQRLSRAGRELVLVVSPAQKIGLARIAVANAAGALRFARLGQIRAGSRVIRKGSDFAIDTELPGLAVDPVSHRAFVVAKSATAEIDLRTLSVSYGTPLRKPAAAAKEVSGYFREARWLGGGLLAVAGTDTEQGRTQPAGLVVADTRVRTMHTIDRDATSFEVAGDLLLATGGGWDTSTNQATGIGLVGYGFDGAQRFRLLDGRPTWVALVYGGRAYVGISAPGAEPLRIVDLAAGETIGTRPSALPSLLLGPGASWWGS